MNVVHGHVHGEIGIGNSAAVGTAQSNIEYREMLIIIKRGVLWEGEAVYHHSVEGIGKRSSSPDATVNVKLVGGRNTAGVGVGRVAAICSVGVGAEKCFIVAHLLHNIYFAAGRPSPRIPS